MNSPFVHARHFFCAHLAEGAFHCCPGLVCCVRVSWYQVYHHFRWDHCAEAGLPFVYDPTTNGDLTGRRLARTDGPAARR